MKIVVFQNIDTWWYWKIVDPGRYWVTIASGAKSYNRKSDAKRGAKRFEQKLFHIYTPLYYSPSDLHIPSLGIPIEVLD